MIGVHQDRVEQFMKKSLDNLQLDYVDLYLIHFPVGVKYVEGTVRPDAERLELDDTDHIAIWKKMEEQVNAGRTKTIGLSNFNKQQIDRIVKSAKIQPACLQVELHVFLQQRELVQYCQQRGIVVVAYSPLGSPGFNKFLEKLGQKPKQLPDMLHDATITKIAQKHDKSNAQILLRYLLQRGIVAIPKSVTSKRIKENIDVFDFALDEGDMKALDDLEVGEDARVCDFKHYKKNMAAKIFMEMPGGFKVPAIGLGTWQVTEPSELEGALNSALEVGYRHIDTAYVYENEQIVGRVINQWISSGKIRRDELFITTKLPPSGVHKDRVELFMKKSLENLQLDYVDLYLVHVPIGTRYDEVKGNTMDPIETDHLSTWKAMEQQVDAGRTKAIGLSNFNAKQIDRIYRAARIKPACLQVELHVYLQQRELVNYCHQHNIVVVAYSPLGSPAYNKFLEGFGKEARQLPDMLHDPVITKIAKNHKKTNAQVMLRYLVQNSIVAIPKSIRLSRIKENIDIFDFNLSKEELKAMDNLEVGESARVVNFQVFTGFPEHVEWPFPK
ncbi:hypothetical protein NQ317_013905 [Molorchus minor]|uniref:NADP-dependent oxidoreductase domain-containing protein n=1 Tax=Molorchus minor TaxID=1323400 RepID=A0ABQ9K7M2_9CUCU|nr:hypothetical protein NQ317_013905 [Molorchus minor]